MRTISSKAFLAVLLPIALGCSSSSTGLDVDLAEFDKIPTLGDLDFDAVQPAVAYDYWEYRFAFEGTPAEVIGSAGSMTRDEIDPGLLAVFDTTYPEFASGLECLPANCYYYVASIVGDLVETWVEEEGIRSFLGPIDASEDAILLVRAEGYSWGAGKETAAIRGVADGYELVVLKTVEFCDPIQTDRYVLHVSTAGELTVRDSEVWSREEGVCI